MSPKSGNGAEQGTSCPHTAGLTGLDPEHACGGDGTFGMDLVERIVAIPALAGGRVSVPTGEHVFAFGE